MTLWKSIQAFEFCKIRIFYRILFCCRKARFFLNIFGKKRPDYFLNKRAKEGEPKKSKKNKNLREKNIVRSLEPK